MNTDRVVYSEPSTSRRAVKKILQVLLPVTLTVACATSPVSAPSAEVIPPTPKPETVPPQTSTETIPPTQTEIPLPVVTSAGSEYEESIKERNPSCIDVKTAVFGDDILSHCKYNDGSDHFFIDQEDKEAIQELDWALNTNELLLHIPLTEGQTAQDAKVIVYWQPNAVDENGDIVVTYNKTGERGGGEFYVIPQVHEDYVTFRTINLVNAPEMPVITQTTVTLPMDADLLEYNGYERIESKTFMAFRQNIPEGTSPEDTKKAKLDLVNVIFNYVVNDNVALGEIRAWLTSSITGEQRDVMLAPHYVVGTPALEGMDRILIISPVGNTAESNKFRVEPLDVKNDIVDGSFIIYRRYDGSFGVFYVDLKVAELRELAPFFELETDETDESDATPMPSPIPSPTPFPMP